MYQQDQHTMQSIGKSLFMLAPYRLLLIKIGFGILFLCIIVRLVQIQVIDSKYYRMIGARQHQSRISLPATRGSIYDRNGNVIASNAFFVSFAADTKMIAGNIIDVAKKFALTFNKPVQHYLNKLRLGSRFVWLERQVHMDYLKALQPEKMNGVLVLKEPKRLYHYEHTAGQLIGLTDIDNKGIAGIELMYDRILRGIDGYVIFQRDGLGNARSVVDYPRIEPRHGHSIYLTIDLILQSIAEEELKKGVKQSNADGGIVIIVQPFTGEVLAIAQYPQFNPASFSVKDSNILRLQAVTDVFEPGSLFKIVTVAAAIENKVVQVDQKFYAEQGVYTVLLPQAKIRKIVDVKKHDWLTFREALAYSSNIVMVKVSDLIGAEQFYKTARAFGFGIATGIDFPGEVKGSLLKPNQWSLLSLNSMAYGYEVNVTPLQLVMAYAAIANGGALLRPVLVAKELCSNGEIIKELKSEKIRQVISPSTARTITECLIDAIEYGTGTQARIKGVKIAGKTGTSKKNIKGKYKPDSYTASFVGFFPADDPKLVCLVMIDNPRGSYYGGAVSAPVFRAISERILMTTDILVSTEIPSNFYKKGDDINVTPQYYENNNIVANDQDIKVEEKILDNIIPEVTGFCVRRAVALLMAKSFEPVVHGAGVVVSQEPPAGTLATNKTKVFLTCKLANSSGAR